MSWPFNVLAALGVKVTGKGQLMPAAILVVQADVVAKSLAPVVTDTLLTMSGAVPVLVMVTLLALLILPTFCGAKLR